MFMFEFQLVLYQSIALEAFYILFFGMNVTGWRVWPEIDDKGGDTSAISRDFRYFSYTGDVYVWISTCFTSIDSS